MQVDTKALLAQFAPHALQFFSGYAQRPFKKIGGDYRGPCPKHNGDGNNCVIHEDGTCHCFSQCGHFDVLNFLMERGLNFVEATQSVADYCGVSLDTMVISADSIQPKPKRQLVNEVEGIPTLDPSLADKMHQRLLKAPKWLKWLEENRGITVDTVKRFKIGIIQPRENDVAGNIRIVFPVFNEKGQLTNLRLHLFAYRDDLTDEKRKELSKTLPYRKGLVADLFPINAIDGQDEAVLTEGEGDAALLNQLGFPAVTGTQGAGNWLERNSESLRSVKHLKIMYDNDAAGKNGALKRAAELSAFIPDVRIASYPEGVKDISEWVVHHGATAEDVRQALEAAAVFIPPQPEVTTKAGMQIIRETVPQRNGGRQPNVKLISDRIITARQIGPPPAELPYIFGPYLNSGATHWLTGQTGIGKSTLVYNIIGALAEGREIWNITCRKQRVLDLDMESGDLGRRLKMHRLYHGKEPPEDWLFAIEPIRLPDELEEFVDYIQAAGVTFVVLDTARRCFSVRDENDNAEVYRNIVPTLDALKQIGVASLVLGHPPKNGGFGARGAGAQEDAGDVNLTLRMHKGEVTAPDGIIALTITKNRLLGLGHPPLLLKRVGNDRFEPVSAEEAGSLNDKEETDPGPGERCRNDMLNFLDERPHARAPYSHIMTEMKERNHTESTAKRALKKLVEEKELVRADNEQFPQGLYCRPDPFADE